MIAPDLESPPSLGGVRRSSTIATLFPPGVVAAEVREPTDVASLHPSEARWCATFAAKRVADFTAGRLCARRALREFGIEDFPLHVNADRRPAWPKGLVGSISHTSAYCGVVVAPATRFESIGFDAESVGGVTEDLWPGLFVTSEVALLRNLPARDVAVGATLIFSAKESYYKCHFGITPTWLDFTDVVVTFDATDICAGTFDVYPSTVKRVRAAVARTGRFALDGDVMLTGVASLLI